MTTALRHLIRLRDRDDRKRAIKAFLNVRDERVVLPGHQMIVTEEHIRALQREQIPFEYLSKTAPNAKKATAIQS